MLEAMRQLALDALWVELDGGKSPNPEAWYQEVRGRELGRLFPKLVEDIEQEGRKDKQRYYSLWPDPNHSDVAILEAHEFKEGDAAKLPFNQASGPQAAALGPVIKRSAPSKTKEAGSLCGQGPVTVYPNELRGAGINLTNLDRAGAFPGLDPSAAWKGFALCIACADLLYVYWHHIAGDYRATIAGYNALVIPSLTIDPEARRKFAKRLREWVEGLAQLKDRVMPREQQLLNILGEERAVTTLTVLWAEFGQRIDDIRGVVSDILPSRLQKLVRFNRQITAIQSPGFPEWPLDEFEYNLPLTILKPLLRRPAGCSTCAAIWLMRSTIRPLCQSGLRWRPTRRPAGILRWCPQNVERLPGALYHSGS
jgi:hypothetical protein